MLGFSLLESDWAESKQASVVSLSSLAEESENVALFKHSDDTITQTVEQYENQVSCTENLVHKKMTRDDILHISWWSLILGVSEKWLSRQVTSTSQTHILATQQCISFTGTYWPHVRSISSGELTPTGVKKEAVTDTARGITPTCAAPTHTPHNEE